MAQNLLNMLSLIVIASQFTVRGFIHGEADDLSTVGFVQDDNERDTISLLISCLATLGLCIYSAVHLNVPPKSERLYRILLQEFKWCIIGLFAPELILYTAWRQLAAARQLQFEVAQAKADEGKRRVDGDMSVLVSTQSTRTTSKDGPWSVAHGYYGVMGGFAIDLDESDAQYKHLFGSINQLTLTAEGVALLSHCGHTPEISIDDIKDKNKADGLAKLLVCIQAGWMIAQVIVRSAQGLPTSLLEVHTVAHVVCALIMYVIWWHKPRQVASPTILKGEWLWPLAAYMFLASRMSGEVPTGKMNMFQNATPILKELTYHEDIDDKEQSKTTIYRQDTANTLTGGHFRPRPQLWSRNHTREPSSPGPESETKAALLQLAVDALHRYPALRSRFIKSTGGNTAHSPHFIPYISELVQPHSLDWPNDGLLRRTQSLVMGMVLWGASMAYGAIHVAAWSYFFPTPLEQLFWRLSSVWVTFCAAFWLITNLLAHALPVIDRVWVTYNERRLGRLGTFVITALCIMCGLSYIVARAYLVVEAFTSIREVPKDVYRTPSWSQMFPHL